MKGFFTFIIYNNLGVGLMEGQDKKILECVVRKCSTYRLEL